MILNLNFTDKNFIKSSSNLIFFIEKDKIYYDQSDFSSKAEINLIKKKIKVLNKKDPIFSFYSSFHSSTRFITSSSQSLQNVTSVWLVINGLLHNSQQRLSILFICFLNTFGLYQFICTTIIH